MILFCDKLAHYKAIKTLNTANIKTSERKYFLKQTKQQTKTLQFLTLLNQTEVL